VGNRRYLLKQRVGERIEFVNEYLSIDDIKTLVDIPKQNFELM